MNSGVPEGHTHRTTQIMALANLKYQNTKKSKRQQQKIMPLDIHKIWRSFIIEWYLSVSYLKLDLKWPTYK
jgi:hypothetical protein